MYTTGVQDRCAGQVGRAAAGTELFCRVLGAVTACPWGSERVCCELEMYRAIQGPGTGGTQAVRTTETCTATLVNCWDLKTLLSKSKLNAVAYCRHRSLNSHLAPWRAATGCAARKATATSACIL